MTAADLKARIDIVEFIRSYGVDLKPDGAEWRACCPFHDERTPSFTVTPDRQLYKCFGCGSAGSVIDFAQQWKSCNLPDAIRECQEWLGGAAAASEAPVNVRTDRQVKAQNWELIIPAPADVPPPPDEFVKRKDGQRVAYPIIARWAYRDANGGLIGYVNRYEVPKPDGTIGKEVTPCVWARNTTTGRCQWKWRAFNTPRPLYGLPDLAARPAAQVLVVEGEKTRDAAQRLLPGLVVVTWAGGGNAAKHADWSPLAGRKVVLWADRDAAGVAAMEGYIDQRHTIKPGVLQMLEGMATGVRVVDPPAGDDDGWDLADAEAEGWTTEAVMSHIRGAMREPRPPVVDELPPPANDNEPPPDYPDYEPPVHYLPEYTSQDDDSEPFRPLGYGPGPVYYYMPKGTRMVMELSLSGHSPANLLGLAPLKYWENRYACGDTMKRGNWQLAANSLIQQSEREGLFTPDRIRGRGAWWDDGKAVIHVGRSVIIDGIEQPLHNVRSRYVYQQGKPLDVHLDDPLSNSEAHELAKLCDMPSWQKPINGKLLAGWIFLAPICGALRWRPHIWVTGSAGSGKSSIVRLILKRALGNIAIDGASSTSEAGLRQTLQSDGLPVVFDEMETDDRNSKARIDEIMKLVTLASDDNGMIIKGSATGKAVTYSIRTMFTFASIAVNLSQHAARTRVTVLEVLKRPQTDENRAHYEEMIRKSATLLTPEYVERLHARAIRMIPVIRQNVEVFAQAAAIKFGDQRMGDQIGTLLAGAWCLQSKSVIDLDKAAEWMNGKDWTEILSVNDDSDEVLCLRRILEHLIDVDTNHGRIRLSIEDLVACAGHRRSIGGMDPVTSNETLKRYGLQVADDSMLVANKHTQLAKILAESPWVNSWPSTLSRISGARRLDPKYFTLGTTSNRQRCVSVPFSVIFG